MLRSQSIRIARSALTATPAARATTLRSYTSTSSPPPSGHPNKSKDAGSNTLLYSVLGVAVGAGAYYYFAKTDDVNAVKEKAQKDQKELEQKARESVQAGKARADDAFKQGQAKYDAAKADGRDKVHEIEERARQVGVDAQGKIDSYKQSAQKTLSDARDSTENLYKEARSSTDHKLSEARSNAEAKAEEVKSGWFSWLGWGRSKAEEKEDVAAKVADSAEDVRKRAEKHT